MKKHEVEYKGERYELTDEQYEELISAIDHIKKADKSKLSAINPDDLVDIRNVNIRKLLNQLAQNTDMRFILALIVESHTSVITRIASSTHTPKL